MARYVNAAEAAEKVAEATGIPLADLVDVFAKVPAADVAPVRRGHWIKYDDWEMCSECGGGHEWIGFGAAYCDECGAKMEVAND